MNLPIGHLLVEQGALTEKQVAQILAEQEISGRPFGTIAEELFGISAHTVERAWAAQYARITEWVDPTVASIDPAVHDLITRRQAWQFSILPMGMVGDTLRVCATVDSLVRALNFATRHLATTCYFVLSKPEELTTALHRYYPMDGMSEETRGKPRNLSAKHEGIKRAA